MADEDKNTSCPQRTMTPSGRTRQSLEHQPTDCGDTTQISDKKHGTQVLQLAQLPSELASCLQLADTPSVGPQPSSMCASSSQHLAVKSSVNVGGSSNPTFLAPVTGTFNFNFVPETRDSQAGCTTPRQQRIKPPSNIVFTIAQMDAAADSCEDALKVHYKSTGSYVQIVPWVDDYNKHIMDIYTELELEEGVSMWILESYESIFKMITREGDPIKRVVLIGLAGLGKSTLVDKMAYDWAVFSQVLRQFKLVFVLKLCSVDASSELIDSIFGQLLDQDTGIDKSTLKAFIHNNPNKVLILMDGFDELILPSPMHQIPPNSILKILNRKICRDCWVVVTTRPSHFDKLVTKQLIQKPFTHVSVTGFTEENITEYVKRFCFEEQADAAGFLERIESSRAMSELAKSPMLLLLMCLLWINDCRLPETISRLYSEAIVYIFKRKSDVPLDDISTVVREVGKIALRGLLSPDKLLSFEEREFEKSAFDLAIKAGLLTSHRVVAKGFRPCSSVHFIHTTFQEYCAAKYLQSISEKEFQNTLDRSDFSDIYTFEYLLRFCCGDNEACTHTILKMFEKQVLGNQELVHMSSKGVLDHKSVKLGLACCFEGQTSSPVEFTNLIVGEEISLKEWDSDSLNSFTFFLKCVAVQSKNRGNTSLAKVQKIHLDKCDLGMFGECLAVSMEVMTGLLDLSLVDCSLTGINVRDITSSLSNTSLTELDLSGNNLGNSAESWSLHLQPLTSLKEMSLKKCSLTGEDGKHILKSLSGVPNLAHLDLSQNTLLSGSGASCFSHLKHCKQLQTLNLSSCSLAGEDMSHIVVSLSDLAKLVELILSRNVSLSGSAAMWSHALEQCKHIQKLDLNYCHLTGEDLRRVAFPLSNLPSLVELYLSLYETQGSPDLWCLLERLNSLYVLDLSACSLTSEDMKHITRSLSDNTNLVELAVSFNKHLTRSLAVWSPDLKHLKHLQRLYFHDCIVGRPSLTPLAASVACMRRIVMCIVSFLYGEFESDSEDLLEETSFVAETSTGIILELWKCSLTNTDLAEILEVLRVRGDVVELTLSKNVLSGSAGIWATHLQHLKRLEKLRLNSCSLTDEDIKQIELSISDLPNLVEVDLSMN